MSTESPYHFNHLLQVSNKSLLILILFRFLMFFHMYIAQGQGQTILCGQNSDVNRKALSLCPFDASFKKIYLKYDFIHILFLYRGRQHFVTLVICCKFLPLNDFLTVFPHLKAYGTKFDLAVK